MIFKSLGWTIPLLNRFTPCQFFILYTSITRLYFASQINDPGSIGASLKLSQIRFRNLFLERDEIITQGLDR